MFEVPRFTNGVRQDRKVVVTEIYRRQLGSFKEPIWNRAGPHSIQHYAGKNPQSANRFGNPADGKTSDNQSAKFSLGFQKLVKLRANDIKEWPLLLKMYGTSALH